MFVTWLIVFCALFKFNIIYGEFHEKANCNCVCGLRGRQNRIVGGKNANYNEQPWTTALIRNGVIYCGATIISKNYLLTAAHCIYTFAPYEIAVFMGSNKIQPNRSELKRVISTIHHENFDVVTFNNDIGLLQMQETLHYGLGIQPACLPTFKDSADYTGEIGLVVGWGRLTEHGKLSDTLKYINVPIWSQEKCLASGYGEKRLSSTMMCAGYEEGLIDACQGDSGGAMLRQLNYGSFQIIGIISWGRGCARPNYPGIYTNVRLYRKWLEENLSNECLCSAQLN